MKRNVLNFIYLCLVLFGSLVATGCRTSALQHVLTAGCEYSIAEPNYADVIIVSESANSVKIQALKSYSIEDQIEIYLYSKRCVDDPRIGAYFVLDGENKIPKILERIRTTKSVLGKADLLDALFYINRDCECLKSISIEFENLLSAAKEVDEDRFTSPQDKEAFNLSFKSLTEQIGRQQQ